MATIKAYLDDRKTASGALAPLKIAINHRSQSAYIPIGIRLTSAQWDNKTQKVVGHTNAKEYNSLVRVKLAEVDRTLTSLAKEMVLMTMTARQVRDAVVKEMTPAPTQPTTPKVDKTLFCETFKRFIELKGGRTKGLYQCTWRRLEEFKGKALLKLHFEDINKEWLQEFDAFLALTSPSANARAIHLRNVRAVFNDAIDNEITTNYPFRRFKIKGEPTRKRSFAVEVLRRIFSHKCEDEWQEKYRDWFTLTFMLIGINVVDLFGVKEANDGRVDYIRAKTHKPYSIKIEPECQALLDRYAGGHHLLGYLDGYKDYRSFYMNLCTGLRQIREQLGLSELTTYWARHSWATVAASLDIPKDTIAHALGHGGNSVTDIYIDFDMKKVDEANRRVLDWVLYGKDWRNPEKPKRGRPKKSA